MDQGAYKWLCKYAWKSLWRVGPSYDYADLVQEGYLCYCLVCAKYPNAVDPPHLMRLFQVTFINQVHDLSKLQSRMAAIIDQHMDLDTAEVYQEVSFADPGDGYFIPNSAPWYVHAFLRVLCDPQGQAQLRAKYRVRLSGIRELTHDRLCRIIGANPATTPTMPDALEEYFSAV